MPNDKKKSSKPQPQSTNVTGQTPIQGTGYGNGSKLSTVLNSGTKGRPLTEDEMSEIRGRAEYAANKVPSLKTKKPQMLNTSFDMPREIMSRPEAKTKEKGLKGLLNRAMEKAQGRYKKVEKVGVGGRKVVKERSISTKDVNGRAEVVREKKKTVTRKGR